MPGLLGDVAALLHEGRRAQARSLAHEAMDRGDREGLVAAALVACRERFLPLARALLERVDPAGDDATTRCLRIEVAWRLGLSDDDVAPSSFEGLSSAQRAALLQLAIEGHRLGAMASLVELEPEQVRQDKVVRQVAGYLRVLGRIEAGDGPSRDDAWRVVVATLPPELDSESTGRVRAVDQLVARWRAAAKRQRSWFRLRARPERVRGAPPVIDRLHAAAGHLGEPPPQTLVIVPDGVLDRRNAGHWTAALGTWQDILVLGLRVHDPATLEPPLVPLLQRHGPIGAADWSSWHLLRERGVESFVSGRLGPRDPIPNGQGLWREGEGITALDDAVGAVELGLRAGSLGSPDEVRGACLAAAKATVVDARSRWPAPMPPTGTSLDESASTGSAAPAHAMHVAMAVDDRLAKAAEVAIESCLLHASLPVCFHLLTRGIDEATRDRWLRLFGDRATLCFHAFDAVRHGKGLHLIAHTTESTLDRLLLPQLLPRLERVIYLDVDLVVMGDLAPLWRLALGDRPLAAKPSSSPGTEWGIQMIYHALSALPAVEAAAWRRALHQHGGLGFKAFNAGVLVMNLARMRQDGATGTMLGLVRHAAMNDQDALNVYAGTRYLPLDPSWNAAPRQDDTVGARIVHFVGPVKPWDELYISRKHDYDRVRRLVEQRLGHADGS